MLNAKDYGVPQNRERVFLVSILGGESYHFPKPFKLEKRLKDVLEEKVEEKYYLSDKMIDYMNRTSSGGIKHRKGIRTEEDETCGTIIAEAQLKTGGGAALLKCVKTDDSLEVLVPYETERDIRTIEEQGQEGQCSKAKP